MHGVTNTGCGLQFCILYNNYYITGTLVFQHLMNYEYDSIVRDLAQYLQWNDSISNNNNTSIGSLFIVRGGGKGETTNLFAHVTYNYAALHFHSFLI